MPENKEEWMRVLVIGNVVLSCLLIVWGISVVTAPKFWFAGAYAEKGEQGDEGPVGDQGPRGNRGPVGPAGPDVDEALDKASELDSRTADLQDQVFELEGAIARLGQNSSDTASFAAETCDVLDDLMSTLEEGDFIYGGYIQCYYPLGE